MTKNLPDKHFSKAKGAARARPPILRAFLADALIVDHFAGGGGASSGIFRALGRDPDIAINHCPEAIAMHQANHPGTRHYISDVFEVDPVEACQGKPVAFLWASPTCTHFSKAKGTALGPEAIKERGLAWVTVRWAHHVCPGVIAMENVEEFRDWGPLHRQHTHGCEGVACAKGCVFGTKPKGRGGKLTRKKVAHHSPGCPGVACIDECLIHTPIKSRKGETFAKFVGKLERLGYVVAHVLLKACDYGAPTSRRRFFLQAHRRETLLPQLAPELRALADGDERKETALRALIPWPTPTHGPGRANPYRTAAECIDWNDLGQSIFERDRPLADKTMARIARGVQRFVIDAAKPFVIPVNHAGYDAQGEPRRDHRVHDIDAPMPTITGARRGGHAVIAPIVAKAKTYGGGGNDAKGADAPLSTITASKRGEHAAIAPVLVRYNGERRPGETRGSRADEPLSTVDTSNRLAIAVPYLVHRSNGERPTKVDPDGTVHPGQAPRIYDPQTPLGTIVAQGQKHALSVAFLVKNNGGNNDACGASGQDVAKPVDTIACRDQKSLAVAHLAKFYGTSTGSSCEDPVPTITTGGGKGGGKLAQVVSFLARYNGESEAQAVDQPLGTVDTRDRYGLVTVEIDGEEYVLVDIRMRMLNPRELFRATGFDEEYVIDPLFEGKPLTKTAQIRMVGNAVPPDLAEQVTRCALGLPQLAQEGVVAA